MAEPVWHNHATYIFSIWNSKELFRICVHTNANDTFFIFISGILWIVLNVYHFSLINYSTEPYFYICLISVTGLAYLLMTALLPHTGTGLFKWVHTICHMHSLITNHCYGKCMYISEPLCEHCITDFETKT